MLNWSKEQWCKGSLQIGSKSCLLYFALTHCLDTDKVRKSVKKLFPERTLGSDISIFNDNSATTFDDVLAVLKDAGY